MKKKLVMAVLTAALVMASLAGCGEKEAPAAPAPVAEEKAEEPAAEEEETEEVVDDQAAADHVAELIDAIYVQERTADTDAQCAAAKEAWDALTDAQKELVEGEEADPDYFGRDTGDASKDDPRNADEIGEKELLVVSFGTSFNDSRAEDIKGIEDALAKANPDWAVRRAFTAQIIINHVQARDGEKIDNMEQAMERAVAGGVKQLVVQPTHLMHGAEYDELMETLLQYADKFESVQIAEPLLGPAAEDAKTINADKKAVAEAIVTAALADAKFASTKEAADAKAAFVLMGQGKSHNAKVNYSQMQEQMNKLGYDNVFIGTVEGEPEETSCEAVIERVRAAGYTTVYLRPLMVVAGDHANNDMAGEDDDSWKSMFEAAEGIEKVVPQIAGLGRIPAVQEIYVNHTKAAMDSDSLKSAEAGAVNAPADGVYKASFSSDSSMFHVNEALEGMVELTVKDGKMTMHLTLPSKNITGLYQGLAADAEKNSGAILKPVVDEVTYKDGSTDKVNGFDVPVPVLDQEFDLALIGKKNKWYDHKVVVSIVK